MKNLFGLSFYHNRGARSAAPLVAVLAVAVLLAGCASSTTTVLQPYKKDPARTFASVRVEHAEDTVDVADEVQAYFAKSLREYLYAQGRYTEGENLNLVYRFIQMDKGSRAARYFIGFGAGKGEMTVEVRFLDATGAELARIQVGGEISMGFFGGDFQEAVSRAARDVADYTFKNF